MKMQHKHFDALVLQVAASVITGRYEEYKQAGLSDKRYRWDILWSTPASFRTPWFDEVYQYCNDDHIDTALRKITGTK